MTSASAPESAKAVVAPFSKAVAELKGSSYTLTALKLLTGNKQAIVDYLTDQMAKAPAFFDGAPMVVDCAYLQEQQAVVDITIAIQEQGIVVVGVQGADDDQHGAIRDAGLAVLRASPAKSVKQLDSKTATPISSESARPAKSKPTMVIEHPVRGGQQVYAKGTDLVVLAAVNRDAEVIADGNIHVWGPLRGKALAGASGDESARIIARQMDAQLVSVAGNYRVLDELSDDLKGRDVTVFLRDGSIRIERI